MAKGTIQDIVVNKKKTVVSTIPDKLNFPPGGGSSLPPFERNYGEDANPPKKKFYAMAVIAVVAFAGLLFTLSVFFVNATVTVYPKHKTISINKTIESSKTTGSDLAFDIITLDGKAEITLPATGTKEVRKKASGTIVIYNAYSSKSQKLIKNTRFETADGKIYRIDSSVNVPGMSNVSEKMVPGSIEAVVYADEPGENYNIGKTDFTIPGFKGDARYSKFYARSKTEMSGGEIGNIVTLSESDALISKNTLKKLLSETLLKDAQKNVPPEFILFDNMHFIVSGEIKTLGKEGDIDVKVEQDGKIHAVIFRKSSIAKFIAKSEISDYDNSPVSVQSHSGLTFSIKNKELVDTNNINHLTISISGSANIVWDIDKDTLINSVLSKPKKNFHAILASFPNITKVELTVTPFWAQTLPENSSEINIKTVLE